MIAILYERRYWNIQVGKVFAIFSMRHDYELFQIVAPVGGYWVWLDEKPQQLCVDVTAAFDRAKSAICEHGNPDE